MAISWEEYFMGTARLAGERSKDPNTQVGACIVNQDNKIVGVGYNGMPKGLDDKFSWSKDGELNKYKFVVHAELNAILNSFKDLKGCTIYTTRFPCSECSKAIAQTGISEVVYLTNTKNGTVDDKAAKHILQVCGVRYREVVLEGKE